MGASTSDGASGTTTRPSAWRKTPKPRGSRRRPATRPRESTGPACCAALRGGPVTLLITATSFPLAVVAGLDLALAARSRAVASTGAAGAYVQAVRGTPLLVQIFWSTTRFPVLGERSGSTMRSCCRRLFVGILCLAGNYAAYEAEVHRAGLEAVPRTARGRRSPRE
ncbi:MAG: ABC transporter permease subunit [Phycisphaerales bacterium]